MSFASLWKGVLSADRQVLRVFFAAGQRFPYPQRLFRRQRLGDEKKVLRRTAMHENARSSFGICDLALPVGGAVLQGCIFRFLLPGFAGLSQSIGG
ncbi:hypothetical protein, partial [Chryseobacterium sp. R2A-55]|uniref:hypothetical protein n=1 Tax=Chryseobacterium sp. R2A-55 TaxID=2744445 RepID=UPI001F43DDC2